MSKLKQRILMIAIAIIFVFFIGIGIDTFYKGPLYKDFCDEPIKLIENKNDCLVAGGAWNEPEVQDAKLRLICNKGEEGKYICDEDMALMSNGWCDLKERPCQIKFDKNQEQYNRNVFVIALVLGIIGLIIGGITLKLESVSSGIMGGSILTIIYGVMRYWGNAQDFLRFIIMGVALVVLIWLGYKKLKD